VFNYPYQAYAQYWIFYELLHSTSTIYLSKSKKTRITVNPELYIQRSARLAFYLDVNPSFDGHEAVLFWTEHYLAEYPDANFSDIQQKFIQSVPES
jgi:hypothetical protein